VPARSDEWISREVAKFGRDAGEGGKGGGGGGKGRAAGHGCTTTAGESVSLKPELLAANVFTITPFAAEFVISKRRVPSVLRQQLRWRLTMTSISVRNCGVLHTCMRFSKLKEPLLSTMRPTGLLSGEARAIAMVEVDRLASGGSVAAVDAGLYAVEEGRLYTHEFWLF